MEKCAKEYVLSGISNLSEPKNGIGNTLIILIFSLVIGQIGFVLRGRRIAIAAIMIAVAAVASGVCIATTKRVDIKTRLVRQITVVASWVSTFYFSAVLMCSMLALNVWLRVAIDVVFLLIICLIPVCMGLRNARRIRGGTYGSPSKASGGMTAALLSLIGIAEYAAVRIVLRYAAADMSQTAAILLCMCGFELVCCVFSIGLLNVQRLYYFGKFGL